MMDTCERFERGAADFFWVPEGVGVVERPEIIYSHCERPAWLYNYVPFVRTQRGGAAALVEEVRARHHPACSRWACFTHAPQPWLEARLERAGYTPTQEMDLRASRPEDYTPRDAPGVRVERVTELHHMRDCHRAYRLAFDRDGGEPSLEFLERELRIATEPAGRVARFVAYDAASGALMASAGLTRHHHLGVGYLWAGGTLPEHRGRGAYSALVAARVALARREGLSHVGLYAVVDTSSPIVEAQGFERLGGVTCWER